jgi:hypothetical protein
VGKSVGFLGAVAATAILLASAAAGPTGAAPKKLDLSTPAAIDAYLISRGIDPATVVRQTGLNNYAGPNCPVTATSCTTATTVVQIADPGGSNTFECTPPATGTAAPNTCFVVQVNGGTARCIEKSSDPTVTQLCDVTQSGEEARAFLAQVVDSNAGTTQNATQIVNLRQDATSNVADIDQTVRYSSTTNASTQAQDAHQRACVEQTSVLDSSVNFNQSETLRAAASGRDPVTQAQNALATANQCDPTASPEASQTCDIPAATVTNNCNILGHVEQASTGGGTLETHGNQLIDLAAHGSAGAANVAQTQGSATGGIRGFVDGDSVGRAFAEVNQTEIQHEFANTSGTVSQAQFGPTTCCTQQGTNPDDVFKIHQHAHQHEVVNGSENAHAQQDLLGVTPSSLNTNGFQQLREYGVCFTTGMCSIDDFAMNNADHDSQMCTVSGGFCITTESCTAAEGEGGCAGTSTTTCSEEEVFNPETGKCEPPPNLL